MDGTFKKIPVTDLKDKNIRPLYDDVFKRRREILLEIENWINNAGTVVEGLKKYQVHLTDTKYK